jgi:hypothetical protein
MPAFASLQQQKRGSEANAARRASMSDQTAKGGIFSQFFHKCVVVITTSQCYFMIRANMPQQLWQERGEINDRKLTSKRSTREATIGVLIVLG